MPNAAQRPYHSAIILGAKGREANAQWALDMARQCADFGPGGDALYRHWADQFEAKAQEGGPR